MCLDRRQVQHGSTLRLLTCHCSDNAVVGKRLRRRHERSVLAASVPASGAAKAALGSPGCGFSHLFQGWVCGRQSLEVGGSHGDHEGREAVLVGGRRDQAVRRKLPWQKVACNRRRRQISAPFSLR